MNNHINHTKHELYNLLPTDIDGVDSLAELALDMRWSWSHTTDEFWIELDPTLWDLTHNPWVVLQTVSRDKLKSVLSKPGFRKKVDQIVAEKRKRTTEDAWFQKTHGKSGLNCVAYFSMEFMLSEALPIYSGGLGNVAGDQLKAASDLGLPVVGVGLLYQRGYFRQVIDRNGAQQALYPFNNPGQLPIVPCRQPNGEWLRLEVKLPGYSLWLRAWQVSVGRVKLYLLDTNDAANFPAHRGITSELYGGGPELRLEQEMILGIGGWRLLRALGLNPQVCHLNEGHAAFAILERAWHFMEEFKQPFEVALAVTRAGNLFTTHTAVPAGFDRFEPWLVEKYLTRFADRLGIGIHKFMALGRLNPNDPSEPFNMAYLAFRGSGGVNGVSELHGKVSRHIFSPLFPRWPEEEVPIGHVTNGVHTPSWDSQAADELWTKACGKERWSDPGDAVNEDIRRVPDEQLWQMRNNSRTKLIEFARVRFARQLAVAGEPAEMCEQARQMFNPNILTLGFARRFATYKRPNLLLHDPGRLLRLLTNQQRPVQLFIAGKAHPADWPGQALIQQWVQFSRTPEARGHVAFLADYDMLLTEQLVQGVDVWVNTPRRPWEASGTSGMKVLVNGGINLSELDGWWVEAYTPKNGWAIGDGNEHGDDPGWDAAEANQLYDILEQQVVPDFYTRNQNGVPTAWIARMRESMATLTARFSANRTVREYTEKYYLPCLEAYQKRSADHGATGAKIVEWQRNLENKWHDVHFGNLKVDAADGQYRFEVEVYPGGVDPETLRVELYAIENGAHPYEMKRERSTGGGGYVYQGSVRATRAASDFTARIIPRDSGAAIPLEAGEILWQK